ncbi:MAG: protein kinase domain-containing protein [Gemmatimonadaceae bacterium]
MTTAPAGLVAALADRYRLEDEVGAGGMATVYLAYDLRHDRKVAVKVLRPELAAIIGGDRFLAEIRTTANLQHPHILPLHDSGEADGKVFYVMPFVEGQSLRTRIMHERQLPVDEAVRITREVASALDYAHRNGIVHRDIKPENILLHDGQALVADFGIALAVSRSDGGTRMTETGMSLGTPHYMAPEQAMGEREISPRADVYALGCVLYECLAGEPPFTGPTAQAIIARVMTEEPRGLQLQRRTIPAHVEAAVGTALEKLPADRFASAAAFSEALANPSYGISGAGSRAARGVAAPAAAGWDPRTWSLPTYLFAAAMLAFAGIAAWLATKNRAEPGGSLPVVAFQALDSVPERTRPVVSVTGAVAWSRPEGIYVRPPGATAPILLAGTERPMVDVLAFSPDGEWLVFAVPPTAPSPSARITLRRIAATGGVPQTLTSDLGGHAGSWIQSATWGDDGNIYLGASDILARLGSILRVSASGGVVDTLLKTQLTFVAPNTLLPGNQTLLFTQVGGSGDPRIMALDLESRDTVRVLPNAVSANWSPTGHVLAARYDGTLLALPFNPANARALGAPVPVADSIVAEGLRSFFSLARNGTLAYVRGAPTVTAAGDLRLALVNVTGTDVEYLPLPPTDHWDGSFSPDGRRVAYIRQDHVWLYDLDLGTHRQLTRDGGAHHNPVWSPDGKRVAFRADRTGETPGLIFAMQADGDTAVVRLGGARASNPAQWLPDNTLLFSTEVPEADVMRLRADAGAPAVPVLNADWTERAPRISPDGSWIAYVSEEDGMPRVNIRRWPALSGKVTASGSVLTSSYPIWSRDSRTLYVQEESQLVAYTLDPRDDGMHVSRRSVLRDDMQGPIAAMHPDGRRILQFSRTVRTDSTPPVTRRMIVVSNWHEVLRARLGGGKPE